MTEPQPDPEILRFLAGCVLGMRANHPAEAQWARESYVREAMAIGWSEEDARNHLAVIEADSQ